MTAIRNYLASRDWVVAVFPRLFELVTELTGLRAFGFGDIGTGGFNGFLDDSGNENEARIQGGHSAALTANHREAISRFVVRGTDGPTGADIPQSILIGFLSRLCFFVWAALGVAIVAAGWWLTPVIAGALGLPLWAAAAIYLVLVLLLLYTV